MYNMMNQIRAHSLSNTEIYGPFASCGNPCPSGFCGQTIRDAYACACPPVFSGRMPQDAHACPEAGKPSTGSAQCRWAGCVKKIFGAIKANSSIALFHFFR